MEPAALPEGPGQRQAALAAQSTRAWVVEEVPELRIIAQPLWDAVQQRLRSIRESEGVQKTLASQFWEHRRARHLLTNKAFCGACRSPLAAIGADHLACGKARRMGICDNRRSVRRGLIESLILDALKDQLMAPDLVAEFIGEFHREINRQRQGAKLQRSTGQSELAAVTKKLDGLVDAIADGLRGSDLQGRLDELGARKRS